MFRGLSVGSHKVKQDVPVHMFDRLALTEVIDANVYQEMAHASVADVVSRGGTPVLFGGALMYLEWFINGGGSVPGTPREQTDPVEAFLRGMRDWERALEYASNLDPVGAARVLPNDYYRLAKVVHMSNLLGAPASRQKGFKPPINNYDYRGAFLYPRDRLMLFRSLDRRCEKMVADGLLEETWRLLQEFGHDKVAMRNFSAIVGYRQAITFLREHPRPNRDDFVRFMLEFQAATRQYSKRQLTYFRNRASTKFKMLRAIPTDPTNESVVETVRYIDELYKQTPEEYASDTRWRDLPPHGDEKVLRTYQGVLEVFSQPQNVRAVLERLEFEKDKRSWTPERSRPEGERRQRNHHHQQHNYQQQQQVRNRY